MKQIFIENAPKRGKYIDWNEIKGMKFNFAYDDIDGELQIVDTYRKNNRTYVLVEYDGKQKEYVTYMFLKGSIGSLVGKNTSDYLYSIGDVLSTKSGNLKILKQTRDAKKNGTEKSYDYLCLNCGSKGHKTEGALKSKQGCSICGKRSCRVNKDINAVSTTHPHLLKNIVDENDANKLSFQSHKEIQVRCTHCKEETTMSMRRLVNMDGYECRACSSRTSYPERFMFNLLTQLNIDFLLEYSPKWAKNKRYDFYIPTLNTIIETHGSQHYCTKNRHYSWKTYEQEHENDLLKFDLSVINGIDNYVVLDCSQSEMEWIKKSIMNSKLPNLLGFLEKDIDWVECDKMSFDNRMIEINKLYMDGYSIAEISNKLKIHQNTCKRWLTRGNKLGMSDYDANKRVLNSRFSSKRVMCIETKEIYNSQGECAREMTKIFGKNFSTQSISLVCRGLMKHHKGYTFKHV